jgi:hypothetical protein
MLDFFKNLTSKGSTQDQVKSTSRAAYLEYVDQAAAGGKQAVPYATWLKERQ